MIDDEIARLIFVSLPKKVMIDGTFHDVYIEYADRVVVTEKLQDYKIVVTIGYSTAETWLERTPTNRLIRIDTEGGTIRRIQGERERCNLTIWVHAKDIGEDTVPASTLVNAYVRRLTAWSYRDLRTYVEVISKNKIGRLEHAEDEMKKREFSVTIGYPVFWEEEVDEIENIAGTINEIPTTWTNVEGP